MGAKFEAGATVASNRRAWHNYSIEDTVEAGLVLLGSEVKSLRSGTVSLNEAYIGPKAGALWLINAHIPEYSQAGARNHEPRRPRKILLRRRELDKMLGQAQKGGFTLLPLKLYFNHRGILKCEVALARGKKKYDKREAQKERDWKRQKARLIAAR